MKKRRIGPLTILGYVGVRLFGFIALALPARMALHMGELLGAAAAFVTPRRRRIAVSNLRQAFPERSRKEAKAMATRVYEHFGRSFVEVAIAPRILRRDNYREYVTIHNEEYIHQVIEGGKGAIWITCHMGVWEIFSIVFDFMGIHGTNVYRPVKNPLIDKMLREHRVSLGHGLVERNGAVKRLLRVLRSEKGNVGMLVDQHAKRDGQWVPFFGRLASTTPAPALLALRTGAPILLWYSRRLPGTFRFEAWFEKPFAVTPSEDRAADVARVTKEISRRIEAFIRKEPEQWLWLHRRWHTPPAEVVERENAHVESSC